MSEQKYMTKKVKEIHFMPGRTPACFIYYTCLVGSSYKNGSCGPTSECQECTNP